MLCKCHWVVLYTVHFTAFCLGGPFFSGHGVFIVYINDLSEIYDGLDLYDIFLYADGARIYEHT